MFWLLDRVIFSCYLIVCACLIQNIWDTKWERYRNIDLGVILLNHGICENWKDTTYDPKPSWICETELIPCDYKSCFYCKNGLEQQTY